MLNHCLINRCRQIRVSHLRHPLQLPLITMVTYHDGVSNGMPAPKRFITTHDESGKAVFYTERPDLEDVTLKHLPPAALHVHYATSDFPVDFAGESDIHKFLKPSGSETLAKKGGTVCRMVDLAPGETSPMHRTVSLDYGVVLEGEAELILETFDGPSRTMRRGDVSVQ